MEPGKVAADMGLEESEYLELLMLFIDASLSDLDELQAAIEVENADRAGAAIHSLKGAAGNLRLDEIHQVARELESKIHAGQMSAVSGAVQTLKDTIEELQTA